MSASATIGCIGKLPLFGDFVRLNGEISPCLSALDRWLQQGIENGYMQEGRPFEAKLRSFQPTRIVCWSAADSGWSGLLMPSADQVGRVYPILTGWQHTNPVTPDVMPLVGREEAEGLQAFVEKAQAERPALDAFLQDLNATTLSPGAPGACAKLEEFLRESSLESLCRGWVDGGIPQRRARALYDLAQLRQPPAPPRYLTVIPYSGRCEEVGFWLRLIAASMPTPLTPSLVAWPAGKEASGSIRILFDRLEARYMAPVLWPQDCARSTLDLHASSLGRREPADFAPFAAAVGSAGTLRQLLDTVQRHFQ